MHDLVAVELELIEQRSDCLRCMTLKVMAKDNVKTLPEYDEMLLKDQKLPKPASGRPRT